MNISAMANRVLAHAYVVNVTYCRNRVVAENLDLGKLPVTAFWVYRVQFTD